MKIYMYISKSVDLSKKFEEYSQLTEKVFDCDDNEIEIIMTKALLLKNEIQIELEKLTPSKIFDEEYYSMQIEDEETKMLLSNGVYSDEQLYELIKKCSCDLSDYIKTTLKSCSKSDKIMFWNC